MYRLHIQFNGISHSLTCESLAIRLNGSVESDITFSRGSDAVNQRNATARNFYRFARSSRDSAARAPHKTKRNNARAKAHYRGGCQGFRCTIREPEREKGRRGGTTSIFSKARKRETKRKRTASRA